MHSGFSADPSQPPIAPLPAISELKKKTFFLRSSIHSRTSLSVRTTNPSTSQLRKFVLNSARHTFKYKGNEEQYQHQEKVASHIDTAIRMKHIVLADLHGWDFVTEYKQIPVPEDETDEKRIRLIM